MLQSIRDNSQSIVAKVIVGLIIVTFALFGVESLVSLTAGSNAPATVNGEEITQQEFYQATELQRRQILSQMGENADPTLLDDNLIQNMVLDRLIEEKALILSGQDKGMLISDRMIDQLIINTPDFQSDGKFNRDQFEAVLRNAGFTPLMYRDLMKKERLIEQQRSAYELSAFATPDELNRIAALDRQTRSASYFVLPLAEYQENVSVSQTEINAEFDKRKADLLTDEQVTIEYLLLDKLDLEEGVEVSEEDIKAEYDLLLAGFEADDQRQVSHILFEISEEQDEAAALKKAEEVKARLDQGEDFAAVAKEVSEDLGSAQQGGDLGVNGKGVFSSEFEETMFSLATDVVSKPVKTEFGYHLIKAGELIDSKPPTLEESRQKLKNDIIAQKVEGIYVEKMERLADLTFSAGDLIEPSEVLEMPIETIEAFSRSGGKDDISSNAKVITAAFSADLIKEGLNSAPIELDQDRTVVIRVKEHFEPREKTLEEVTDQLKQELSVAKASEVMKSDAEKAVSSLAEAALAEVAGEREVKSVTDASRAAADLPFEVRSRVFAMPHPADDKLVADIVELNDGSLAVVALEAVNTPAVELTDDELKAMSGFLGSRQGQQDYQSLVSSLKTSSQIEKL